MSAIEQASTARTHVRDAPSPERRARRLRIIRWTAIAVWATVVIWRTFTDGFAFNRELLLVYICTGLVAASIGQGRRVFYVVRDWLPFALVLIAYDLSRGAATLVGRPTLWHWQADMDRWMFFGTMPTVWLLIKTYLIVFVFIWVRATLPRMRYDQLMTLGWKRLIPGALGWLIVSALVIGIRRFGLPFV